MTTDKPDPKNPKDEMDGQTNTNNLDNNQTAYPEDDDYGTDEPMMDRLI